MDAFRTLIDTHETWLTRHVLENARFHDYTGDSSTLEQPWRAAICGFSEPMSRMLDDGLWPPDITQDAHGRINPLFAFSTIEARLHRERGVALDQYMGLTKYYRRAYLELIAAHVPSGETAEKYRAFVNLFFDNAEIAICTEWKMQTEPGALQQAADTNRQLVNEKNRYLTIFESLNEPVLILGKDQKLINLNLAAHQLFNDDAISGQAYYADIDDIALTPQLIEMLDCAGEVSELEYKLETRRGPRTFQVKIQRMLDISEKFTGTVVILTDITDFRAAQRASEAADRAKNAFLATMSHEIRTPINGILGIAQLLRDGPLNGRQSEYVDALLSSGELLLDLVNDVLDYTKLEAGEGAAHPSAFSPRDMIERVARLSMGEAARKGLVLDLDIARDCPAAVLGDSKKIQRILLNLINNAVKFTREGSVAIVLAWEADRLRFTVRDTGPGIPEQDRSKVFTPFFQSMIPGKEAPVGTGLGLPICARLAELMGADLTLETPADGGALFRLECPVEPADPATLDTAASDAASRPLDILLVEDNPINSMVIDGFLASDGHRIDAVTNGEAALARLRDGAYDLVLMDIRLEGADGFEIIRRIRTSQDQAWASLPILVLTADQSDATAHRFARSGADAFQSKPLSRDELRRAIWRVMSAAAAPARAGHTPSPAPEDIVLDPSVIAEHRAAIGEERTERILAAFLSSAAQQKAALRAASGAGDRVAMADIAHGLRSAAQMIGLMRLGRLAETTERAVLNEAATPDRITDVADALSAEVDVAEAALRGHTEPA